MSRSSLQSLLESLESFVRGIRWVPQGTEWADYEEAHGYGQESLDLKAERVRTAVERTAPARVWDLGANTGAFSRIARDAGASVIAVDADPAAVDRNFRREQNGPGGILPLLVDLAQPSPSLGWATSERMSLAQRGPADMVLALALIHHLAITNNVPLPLIASWISGLGQRAVVEWVPKSDPQAQRLLLSRRDIFDTYSEDGFVEAFSEYFDVETREPIPGTDRVIYSLTRRPGAGSPDARNPGGGAA
jgi:ribosomal protein L11 methylase PrmA